MQALEPAEIVIVGLHGMNSSAGKQFGISKSARRFLDQLNQQKKVVLAVFGNPYSLKYFDDMPWLLQAYEGEAMMQELAAEALFGAQAIRGRLPVTASDRSTYGTGEMTRQLARFGYAPPAAVGLNAAKIEQIEKIAEKAIATRATPGCVVLVAKDQKIVYEKAFGHHTYDESLPVNKNDLYDLASLTKVASATLAVMKLYEEGAVSLDTPIVKYLPELEGTNKAPLCLRDIMAHRAGLKDWIPFYKQTVYRSRRRTRYRDGFYRQEPTRGFEIEVADQLFLRDDWRIAFTSRFTVLH